MYLSISFIHVSIHLIHPCIYPSISFIHPSTYTFLLPHHTTPSYGHSSDIVFVYTCDRFYTCTGNYKGQRVSIVGTGMGIAMIDFSIREIRHLFGPKEKLFMIRLGTCGSPQHNIGLGTVVVNDSSIFISRNPDAFRKVSTQGKIPEVQTAYRLSLPCKSNENLTQLLYENMKKIIGEQHVIVGLNATADSFYSSQGRRSTFFVDSNEELIDYVISKYQVCSLEMESFHLFDMADCSLGSICATSAELVLAQRRTNEFIDPELRANRECQLGLAGLETLIQL